MVKRIEWGFPRSVEGKAMSSIKCPSESASIQKEWSKAPGIQTWLAAKRHPWRKQGKRDGEGAGGLEGQALHGRHNVRWDDSRGGRGRFEDWPDLGLPDALSPHPPCGHLSTGHAFLPTTLIRPIGQPNLGLAGWSRQSEAVKWWIAQKTSKNTTITLMDKELM